VAHRPAGLTAVEAATLPIAFLSAHYALNALAGMRAGQRILIHAAAGGVGMAAIQLAQRAGAEIFATAGSPQKRALLHRMGVQYVSDSRSLDFVDDVRRWTGGQGVDLVLNSLAGEFIPASLSLLASGGHFLELGKTDVWDTTRVKALRPDARYTVVYLGDLIDGNPAAIQDFLRELLPCFGTGTLRPLPVRAYPLVEASQAFRRMAQGLHVGKLVLTHPLPPPVGLDPRPDATYLVTGGLGGLGQQVATRLVERGARNLVLVGRSEPSQRAAEMIQELEQRGARVRVLSADVSLSDDVRRIIDEIERDLPPLRGVIHAAGVLDDGVLAQQTWQRFARVLAPKVGGAWNLHQHTRHLPLDFFVCYSAFGGILGMAGQGSYSAANAYLDALAQARRAEGLAGLSISWGAWSGLGMVARMSSHDRERAARSGFVEMAPDEALDAQELALQQGLPHVIVSPIDLDALLRVDSRPLKLLAELVSEADSRTSQQAPPSQLLERWRETPPAGRRKLLLGYIRGEAIRALGLPPTHSIAPHQALGDLGLDSLMAVELRNGLGQALDYALPATLLFDYPTCEDLIDYLIGHVPALASTEPASPARGPEDLVDDLSDLSDISEAEAEALLLAELAEIRSLGESRV
jgi:NADPH:quinone reductase-like Zn-dependent oxidoreductase/acyl carrier protein